MPDTNGKLGLEEVLSQAAGNEPAVEAVPPTTPEATPPVTAQPTTEVPAKEQPIKQEGTSDPKPTPTKQDETKPQEQKDAKGNPIKEIREKYNAEKTSREKVESTIQRYSTGAYDLKLKDFMVEGKVDYDALVAAMDAADTKVKAEARGITPEVQAEIDRIEKEKIEIQKQKLQISMDRALTNLQQNMNIKGADVNNFFKDAMAVKKNPYQWIAQGGDLQDLYILIYRDRLLKTEIDKAVGAAKAKWEEEALRKTKVPAANPAQQTQASSVNNSGISLEDLLTQAASKK